MQYTGNTEADEMSITQIDSSWHISSYPTGIIILLKALFTLKVLVNLSKSLL